MVYGLLFYWDLFKLVQGERFRRNDWLRYQLFAKKLAQFCENAGFGDGLYDQYEGLFHFVTVRKMKFNLYLLHGKVWFGSLKPS